jgi:catechol 2,3-dioxygenase-like lactoylglutathione lyase family enzyme
MPKGQCPPAGRHLNRRVRPVSNFENLKKQAKLVLRWHRDGYYPVAAQIRAFLPRYRHLTDPEVIAAPFKLGDAQELVARQQGFESWQALKTGLKAMPESRSQTQSKAVICATAAQLFVTDIKAACDFFTQKLGFSIVFVYGEPPFYAQVKRDRGRLNLKHMDAPVIEPKLRDREVLLSSDMGVDTHAEIKQLFLEFQTAGVTFFQALRKEPWGASTFIVKDPDGNLLLFAGPAD